MPAPQPSKELRALCHEHHVEMRLNQSFLNSPGDAAQMFAYACTKPACLVHYNMFRGYFLLAQNGNTNEMDMVPRVRCAHDGAPMYLAKINPAKRGFRQWACRNAARGVRMRMGWRGCPRRIFRTSAGKNAAQPERKAIPLDGYSFGMIHETSRSGLAHSSRGAKSSKPTANLLFSMR